MRREPSLLHSVPRCVWMKFSRVLAAWTMILGLVGLMAHQHDSDESRDDCPAAAWHSGAMQCAAPQAVPPDLPEYVVKLVTPSIPPVAAQVPELFRPRGPPSTPA